MKLNTNGKKAYKLVYALLLARRNNNVKLEQLHYTKLMDWCNKNGADMESVIKSIQSYMKTHKIAPNMNSVV